MKILLLGSGAREHALARALSRDPETTELVVAPGNPGTAQIATNLFIDPNSPDEVVTLAREMGADLVVVGPEAPLVAGVADALRQADIAVFGPSRRLPAWRVLRLSLRKLWPPPMCLPPVPALSLALTS